MVILRQQEDLMEQIPKVEGMVGRIRNDDV